MTHPVKFVFYSLLSPTFASLAMVFLVGSRYGEPVWLLGSEIMVIALSFGASFLCGLLVLKSRIWRTEKLFLRLMRVGVVSVLVSWPLVTMLMIVEVDFSRIVLVYEIALLFGLLLTNDFLSSNIVLKTIALAINFCVFSIAVLPSFSEGARSSFVEMMVGSDIESSENVDYVFSSLSDLKVTNHLLLDQQEDVYGGALRISIRIGCFW